MGLSQCIVSNRSDIVQVLAENLHVTLQALNKFIETVYANGVSLSQILSGLCQCTCLVEGLVQLNNLALKGLDVLLIVADALVVGINEGIQISIKSGGHHVVAFIEQLSHSLSNSLFACTINNLVKENLVQRVSLLLCVVVLQLLVNLLLECQEILLKSQIQILDIVDLSFQVGLLIGESLLQSVDIVS